MFASVGVNVRQKSDVEGQLRAEENHLSLRSPQGVGCFAYPAGYHGVLAVKGGAPGRLAASPQTLDSSAAPCWFGPGKFALETGACIMSSLTHSSPEAFFVRDQDGIYHGASADSILTAARVLADRKLAVGVRYTCSDDVAQFLCDKFVGLEHEVFAVFFLDAQHRLIEFSEMFRGTLTSTSVHPREILKRALKLNAGAIIISHNHPSGCCADSNADRKLTQRLQEILALIDVKLLDHIIVGGGEVSSFAELGLL